MVRTDTLVALAALFFLPVRGFDLDTSSDASVKSVASSIASGMVSHYNGNETGEIPGLLSDNYYWWNAGAMFDTLIQYWQMTGDGQYNNIVSQALQFQQGDADFMPLNQTKSLGNDDQATWALAAMSAAEVNLPEPKSTSWVALADAVFNEQAVRWDTTTCGGGLRWQIFTFNAGYNYKNSITNGDFFQLAARLARYTGNTTYSDWASKAYDWTTTIGFIDEKWRVFDGADASLNCSRISKIQTSYASGTFISGAAHMYNITTGDAQKKWKTALDGLLSQTLTTFFPNGIATEVSCEDAGTCNTDFKTFKGLLAHWLIEAIKVAPYTAESILPKLTTSAEAAAKACDSTGCALTWNTKEVGNDDEGVGESLSALSYVQGLLVGKAAAPGTAKSSGSGVSGSAGNGTAAGASGTQSSSGTSTPTSSGTGAPSSTPNAAVPLGSQNAGVGMAAAMLGSMAWLML